MSSIKELFFKNAVTQNRTVNRQDVLQFVEYLNKVGDEGSQFDAKDFGKILNKQREVCYDKVRTQLAKHISAFANTSGGLLAIGIRESKKGKPKFSLNNYNLLKINSQHLQRAITGSVEPKVNFFLEIVPLMETLDTAKGILLIFIEPSLHPPHQVTHNRTYYFRHGDASNPAPHSLVSAMFGNRRQPLLMIDLIKLGNPPFLRVIIKNKGNAPAQHTHILINIFPSLVKGNQILLHQNQIEKTTDGLWNIKEFLGSETQNFMKFRLRAKSGQVVLPGMNEILFDFPFKSFPGAKLHANIYCDQFESKQEFFLYKV